MHDENAAQFITVATALQYFLRPISQATGPLPVWALLRYLQGVVRRGMTSTRRETWQPSTPDVRPGLDEVHIWRASLDRDDSEFERHWATLTPDERGRAQRFHFDRDRRRFVVARGLLREILGRCVGLAPALLRFAYDEYGKPSLKG